jgi:hypothetical protein
MARPSPEIARRQLLLVAAAFVLPLLIAVLLYYGGYGPSSDRGTQHGILLQPIVHIPDVLQEPDLAQLSGQRWLLVYTHDSACNDDCKDALHRLRQVRLMLGNDMNRLQRLFLHGDSVPDKVFLQQEHKGLKSLQDKNLGGLLNGERPSASAGGGFYLIDPFGNLVMYFPPDLDPGDLVDDLKHLLELSRIG